MEVLEFRKIRVTDRVDTKYNSWSRIYEYPLVLDILKKYNVTNESLIHNTSWGWEGCHVQFKEDLDNISNRCLHSDLKASKLPKTTLWNLTHKPNEEWVSNFDFVINVSTIEEVKYNHVEILNNLVEQLNDGGILIITFDLPGLQLDSFEKLLKSKIEEFDDEINGGNSHIKNNKYDHLTCGLLVIRK